MCAKKVVPNVLLTNVHTCAVKKKKGKEGNRGHVQKGKRKPSSLPEPGHYFFSPQSLHATRLIIASRPFEKLFC